MSFLLSSIFPAMFMCHSCCTVIFWVVLFDKSCCLPLYFFQDLRIFYIWYGSHAIANVSLDEAWGMYLLYLLYMSGLQSSIIITQRPHLLVLKTCLLIVSNLSSGFVDMWILMIWHFVALNFMLHLSAHVCSSSRSFWKLISSWTDFIALYIWQSSTNSLTCDETDFVRSFMYMKQLCLEEL